MVSVRKSNRFAKLTSKTDYMEELPKITPHIARQTYCTNLVKRQVSVKTVQYMMGHADVGTTLNIYTHAKLVDARNELRRMKCV